MRERGREGERGGRETDRHIQRQRGERERNRDRDGEGGRESERGRRKILG